MQAYWADLKLFFQRAGADPTTRVILHVEPDLWGYVQQRATTDDAEGVRGAQVVVVAPVAGRIVVQGKAIYNLSHTTGTGDQIHTFIGTTATDCPAEFGWADITYVHTTQPSAVVNTTAHATRMFDVAAGTYTYFLNSRQVTGGGTDRIDHGLLVATFEPN